MKFNIDLNNYPDLKELFETDQQSFIKIVSGLLVHINNAVADNRINSSLDIYKMEYIQLLNILSDVFFNYEGIVQQHHNNAEKEGLRALQEDLHPLSIFTNNAPVFNAKGDSLSPFEWIEQDKFDLKNWLYALFYGARFVSWKELSEYLTLGQYELIDILKARNFEQLSKIQPALDYQRKNEITVGKLIEGTGIFDGGEIEEQEKCIACGGNWITDLEKYSYCPECRLGGLKQW